MLIPTPVITSTSSTENSNANNNNDDQKQSPQANKSPADAEIAESETADEEDDDDDNDNDGNNNGYVFRPWIEGVLEKLMPQKTLLGNPQWRTRLFRLFDEALVWFEDEGFFSKLFGNKKNTQTMKPYGVLPLAMITGLKTADIMNKADNEITEDELLRLELEIGDEGTIVLRCADYNQRIKWFECLHTAIFTVQRPMFAKVKCFSLFCF